MNALRHFRRILFQLWHPEFRKAFKKIIFHPSEHYFFRLRYLWNQLLKLFQWASMDFSSFKCFGSLSQEMALVLSLMHLPKFEKWYFQKLRTFVFHLTVASKVFVKTDLMTNFWVKQSWRFCLAFSWNGFNFVSAKIYKKVKNVIFEHSGDSLLM